MTPQKAKKRRPSRYKDLGPLQDVLLKACPPNVDGHVSITVLAEALGCTPQYIYSWLKRKRVPSRYLHPIVALSNGRITLAHFHPFLR